jgi:hypothetical protein
MRESFAKRDINGLSVPFDGFVIAFRPDIAFAGP